MTLHNYRSRQVHKTLNGVNPSSSFRDMRSAKSGPNLWQIWQVFGPWASPYGANGQITMTVHNYRPRQFHRTSNGENPSCGYRDMGSASLAAARPAARPPEPWRQYPSSPKGWGVKTLQHGNQPGEVSNNKYICSSNKQDYYSLHVHLHSVCSIFQRMFCLYLFLICRPLISFTNFIKSLSLLITFLLNFRHGLSIDRSHVHLSIYKWSFYHEFQQISMW